MVCLLGTDLPVIVFSYSCLPRELKGQYVWICSIAITVYSISII